MSPRAYSSNFRRNWPIITRQSFFAVYSQRSSKGLLSYSRFQNRCYDPVGIENGARNMKKRNICLSLAVLTVVIFCFSPLGTARGDDPQPAEFVPHAKALPYPPDAREIEFSATFERIEFTSQSSLGALAAFYRAEMKKRGWEEDAKAEKIEDDSVDLKFKHGKAQVKLELDKRSKATLVRLGCKKLDFEGTNDPAAMQAVGVITVVLTPRGEETTIQITTRNEVKAKQDGVLPEAGKARLILGNAHTRPVVITIVKRDYTLRPGQGGRDLKTALNYSVVAGKYPLTIKIPGEKPQSEEIDIVEGTAWGVIALPTGGYFAEQLY